MSHELSNLDPRRVESRVGEPISEDILEQDCGCHYSMLSNVKTYRCPQHDYAEIKNRIKQMDRKMRKLLVKQLNLEDLRR